MSSPDWRCMRCVQLCTVRFANKCHCCGMPIPGDHVSLDALWAYRFTKTPLATDDLEHICKCEDCLNLLGVCQISKSLQEVERRLKEHDPSVLTRTISQT